MEVAGRIATNDPVLMRAAALAVAGLAHLYEHTVAEALAAGTLVRVLAEWCPPLSVFGFTTRAGGSHHPRCGPSSNGQEGAAAYLIEFRLVEDVWRNPLRVAVCLILQRGGCMTGWSVILRDVGGS